MSQLLFRKRFSKGFQSSVAYTHQAARQQWQPNQFDPALAWELNPNARPNRFVWTTVWELPFGRGRQWLTHGPLQHIVGGWQLSWIYQYQTGPLINWGNLYYYGSMDQVVAALNHDKIAFAERPGVVQSERGVQQRDQPGRCGYGSHSFRIHRI